MFLYGRKLHELKRSSPLDMDCEAQIMVKEAMGNVFEDMIKRGVTLEQLTGQILWDLLHQYYAKNQCSRSAELYMAKDIKDFVHSSLAHDLEEIIFDIKPN